jgi:hypothetical protein
MKKISKLSIGLLVVFLAIVSSCSKDSNVDPADVFVGSYTYTMTASGLGTQSGNLTITKTAANKVSVLTADGTPTPYTVSGNNITEDANQTVDIPVSATSTASFTETSTGSLGGSIITINGSWSNPQYQTLTFKVVATKK